MIKLIVFDLDGVLVDSKNIHYEALNLALKAIDNKYVISKDEHLTTYDGLPTVKKLQLLTVNKELPEDTYDTIWKDKQTRTFELINKTVKPNNEIINLFKELKNKDVKIWVASNSITNTLEKYLKSLGLFELVDGYVSNEKVKKPKPNPEMYLKCMVENSVYPKETIIVEDSQVGIEAALSSGANIITVKNSRETNRRKILETLNKLNGIKEKKLWVQKDLNILIPMAGAGSRFANAGYTFPKPLIEVNGKPMIQLVVENLNIDANYIFLVQKEHYEKYNLKYLLNLIAPGCTIIEVNGLTEGACCTTLLAEKYIDNNEPLLIANSDQYLEWNSGEFMYSMIAGNNDGGLVTFSSTHPKWSFTKIDENGYVTEIAEKKVISDIATTGLYFWAQGKNYVKYAKEMINKNKRVNNEFYTAPVFNEAIEDNKKFKTFNIEKMWGLGTPEDLNYFLNNHNDE